MTIVAKTKAGPCLDDCSALFLPTETHYTFRTVKTERAGKLNGLINKFHFLLLSGETRSTFAERTLCYHLLCPSSVFLGDTGALYHDAKTEKSVPKILYSTIHTLDLAKIPQYIIIRCYYSKNAAPYSVTQKGASSRTCLENKQGFITMKETANVTYKHRLFILLYRMNFALLLQQSG